ncbi:MAG: hypothetical protein IPQ22_17470 [Rhodoferax sp.]|nr:hypothetical protein [Rhodoferax sp.]
MKDEKAMDKDEEIECLKQKISALHTRLGVQTDEANRYRTINDEQWTRLRAFEQQLEAVDDRFKAFKDAVMLVVKELARE